MRVDTIIPAKVWLWTAKLTPMSRQVVAHEPLLPTRYERIDGVYMAVITFEAAEGSVVLTTQGGTEERTGDSFVVLGDILQHVHDHEAQDLIDPAGATERLHERLKKKARLSSEFRRFRFPNGHFLKPGEFMGVGSWWGIVGEVTARQAWMRSATYDEILANRMEIPVAPVGAELIARIRAEVAETEAEAA